MQFGLKTAPQSFQRFIYEILSEFEFCFTYIDDIVIFSRDEENHLRHLEMVVKKLKENNLCINLDKCQLNKQEV